MSNETWIWRDIQKVRRKLDLRWRWLGFRLGVKNLWRFRSVVWHFDTCDFTGLLGLMRVATREMAIHHREHGKVTTSPRSAKQLAIVSELCRRLDEEPWYEHRQNYRRQQTVETPSGKRKIGHITYMANQDATYLGKMFKYVCGWWD